MAVSDALNALKQGISDAYTSVEEKGGTIPEKKNVDNLAGAIGSISGGGSDPEVQVLESDYIYEQESIFEAPEDDSVYASSFDFTAQHDGKIGEIHVFPFRPIGSDTEERVSFKNLDFCRDLLTKDEYGWEAFDENGFMAFNFDINGNKATFTTPGLFASWATVEEGGGRNYGPSIDAKWCRGYHLPFKLDWATATYTVYSENVAYVDVNVGGTRQYSGLGTLYDVTGTDFGLINANIRSRRLDPGLNPELYIVSHPSGLVAAGGYSTDEYYKTPETVNNLGTYEHACFVYTGVDTVEIPTDSNSLYGIKAAMVGNDVHVYLWVSNNTTLEAIKAQLIEHKTSLFTTDWYGMFELVEGDPDPNTPYFVHSEEEKASWRNIPLSANGQYTVALENAGDKRIWLNLKLTATKHLSDFPLMKAIQMSNEEWGGETFPAVVFSDTPLEGDKYVLSRD